MNVPLTEVDLKILSDLVYLNITGNTKLEKLYKENQLTVGDLVDFYKYSLDKGIDSVQFKTEADYNAFKELTDKLSDPSSKFYNWKVSNKKDNNATSGFVAYTFEPPGNTDGDTRQAVVAFRGSEEISEAQFRNDWINNVSSWYEEETLQQADAKAYMNKDGHLSHYDDIAITGHSLGGNLALYGTITADSTIKDKITQTYTYNAPGFNKEFIESHMDAINKMESKISEYQTEHDMVSSLFHNLTTPIIIKSVAKDPKIINFDNHGLAFMAMEDGKLVRADRKDFACKVVEDITKKADQLPNFLTSGFSNLAVSIWTGQASTTDIVMLGGAVVISAIAVISTVGIGVTVAAVATVVAAVLLPLAIQYYVLPFIENLIDDAAAAAKEFGKKAAKYIGDVFEFAVNFFNGMDHRYTEFRNRVLAEVDNFFDGIGDWIGGLFGGGKSKDYDEPINVNTAMLRNLANRLNMIQNKVLQADRRISTLRGLVDFDEMLPLLWLDMQFGFDHELKACMDFLNRTADRLDQCEGSLVQKAHAF